MVFNFYNEKEYLERFHWKQNDYQLNYKIGFTFINIVFEIILTTRNNNNIPVSIQIFVLIGIINEICKIKIFLNLINFLIYA